MGIFSKRKSFVAPELSVNTAAIDTGYYGSESSRLREAVKAKNELPAVPLQHAPRRAPGRRAPPPITPPQPRSPDTPLHQSTKSLSSDFLYVTSESSYTSSEGEKYNTQTSTNTHSLPNTTARAPPQQTPSAYHHLGGTQRWPNGMPNKLAVHQAPPATPQQHHVTYPSAYPPPPSSDTSLEYTSTVSAHLPSLAATTRPQQVPPMAHYGTQFQSQNQNYQQWKPSLHPPAQPQYQPQSNTPFSPPSESDNDSSSGSYDYESSASGQSSDANKLHPYYQQWKEYYATLAAMNNGQQQRNPTPPNNRHSMYVGNIPQQQELNQAPSGLSAPVPRQQSQQHSALDIQKQRKRHSIASMASQSSSRVPLYVMKSSAITKDTSVHSFAPKQQIVHSNSQYSFAPSPNSQIHAGGSRDYLSSYSAAYGEEVDNELVLKSRKSILRSSRYPSEPMSVHLNQLSPMNQPRITSFSGTYTSKTSNDTTNRSPSLASKVEAQDDDFDFQSSNNGNSNQEQFSDSDLDYGSDDEDIVVPMDPVTNLHEELVAEQQLDPVVDDTINKSFSSESETTFAVNTNLQSRSTSRKDNENMTLKQENTNHSVAKDDEMTDFARKLEELDMEPLRKPSKQISDYSKFLFDDSDNEDNNINTENEKVEVQLMTPETYKEDTLEQQSITEDDASIQSDASKKFSARKPVVGERKQAFKVVDGEKSGNISLSEISPPRSPPQVDSLDSSEVDSTVNSNMATESTLDPRKYRSQLMYSIPTNANNGEFPQVPQPPMMAPNMFGSPTPSLFSDTTSASAHQQNQMQMQMMMQMMQMMNPMFNPMQFMNPMMYEMMKNQNGVMTPEMAQVMYNGMNSGNPQREMDHRHLMFPQMNSLMPNLAPEHRFSMIGLNGGMTAGSSPGTSPVRRRPISKDQEISEKIEDFVKLRQIIANGNKSLEHRLKWIKMLISATNYKLYQLINIKGSPIRPEDVLQSKQLFIKSSINHLVKLVKDDNLKDDSIRSECYYLYASLFKLDYLDTYGEDFGFEKDIPQAIEWYTKCLDLYPNDYKSLYKLGEIYEFEPPAFEEDGSQIENGAPEQAFNTALDYYKQSAKFGYNRAIYKISLLYLNSPEIRSTKFFRYFYDLANINVEEIRLDGEDKDELVEIIGLSCFQLGRIYEGIYPGDLTLEDEFIKSCLEIAPVNYAKALSYYNKSAKSGCLLAQVRLGYIYEYGELDRQKNAHKSVQWYLKATNSSLKFRRSPKAMIGLARWCMLGTDGASRNIPKEDHRKAISWVDRAIDEFEDADAYYMKGELCEQGVCQEDATKYYQMAYQRGHQLAGNKL